MSILSDSNHQNQDPRLLEIHYSYHNYLGEIGRQFSPDYLRDISQEAFELALSRLNQPSPEVAQLLESAWKLAELARLAQVDRLSDMQGQAVTETVPVITRLLVEVRDAQK